MLNEEAQKTGKDNAIIPIAIVMATRGPCRSDSLPASGAVNALAAPTIPNSPMSRGPR